MRFLSLEVQHFGPIVSASLELGPGLNVLYGPNDLGKSHLAEALRAALLLVPTSKAREAYVPWDTDRTPEVTLVFQTAGEGGEPERWRVHKAFGAGVRGAALLERATGDGAFRTECKGREVEGRLRALLGWGVQPPGAGGKRGQSGLPDTYLSRLLIGRQAEAKAIFAKSLADDPDDSGKRRLTAALHAMAQDPLFARVLERAQARVDQAFSATGGLRRAKDSPLVRAREAAQAAEQRLIDLRQQAAGGAGLKAELEQLLGRRALLAGRLREAEARLERVREAHRRAQARRAAAARLAEARRALDAVRTDEQAAARKAAEVEVLRATLKAADDEHARAREAMTRAHEEARAAEARLEAARAEREGALELRRRTLETRRAELEAQRAEAARRVEAARKVGALAGDAEAREREVEAARAERARLEAAAALADATLRREVARRDLLAGRRAVRAAEEAERLLAARRAELDAATAGLAAADAALAQAEAAVTEARERLVRAQGDAGAQRRALEEEALARRRLEAQAQREQALAEARGAREALAARERADERASALEVLRAAERGAADAVASAEAALAAAEGELERLGRIGAFLEWRAAAARLDEAERAAAAHDELRRQAAALRASAQAVEAELAARPLPDPGALLALRALERELGLAEARLDVGVSVEITAKRAFDLVESVDGGAPESTPADPGDELECVARKELRLVIGDVAELVVRGGRPEDRQLADALRARWQREVAPALAAAGASDLSALEALVRDAAERRLQAAGVLQQAAGLDAQADRLGDVAARADEARREVAGRLGALQGHDPAALEREAAGLGLLAPAGPLFSGTAPATSPAATLEARRREAEARVAGARQALEAARVERGQAALRVETAAREAEEARAAADALAAALGAPAEEALARAEARVQEADARLASLEQERGALEQGQSAALAEAKAALERAEAARADARRACEVARAARDAAQAAASASEAQLEVRRREAAAVDVAALEERLRACEQELVRAGGTPTSAPDAPTPDDLVRLGRDAETAREAVATARATVAGREAACDAAKAALEGAARELGEPWREALSAAEARLSSLTAELEGVSRDLAALDRDGDEVVAAARGALDGASARLAEARAREEACARAREEAKAAVDVAQGELGALQQVAARHDRAATEAAVARAQAELDALPAPEAALDPTLDAGLAHDDAALAAAEQAAGEARRERDEVQAAVDKAQAKLEVTGGAVIQERIADAEQALERLRRSEEDVEREYQAWRLLRDVLVEAETKQQANLGKRLVKPVARRFRELTRAGYGDLDMGPNLETEGITVAGARRPLDALSVGTLDQLATLLCLTVAAELDHALVLDDQLAQSDPGRLGWFSTALRDVAARVQVLVLTCRPDDYLRPDERPDEAASWRASADGALRAVDLARVVRRAPVRA